MPDHGRLQSTDLDDKYRTLFEAIPDGILIVDDAGHYVEVNESLCRLLKTSREKLIGAHFGEFIPPESLQDAQAEFGVLKRTGSFRGEFPLRAADGSLVELEWTARASFLPGLHFCIGREITERKLAEAALKQHAQRLSAEHAVTRILSQARSLAEGAPEMLAALGEGIEGQAGAVWELDEKGETLRCTAFWSCSSSSEVERFAAECRGRSFDRGIGLPGRVWDSGITMAIPALRADDNFPRFQLAAAAGFESGMAFPIRNEKEFFGVFEFFTERHFEPDPALLQMMTAIGRDIAEFIRRLRAESTLANERERLRLALQAGRMGTWEWSIRTGRIDWSPDLAAIHGLAPGSFGGTFAAYLEDVHPHDRAHVQAELRRTLEEGTDLRVEYRLLWHDGSTHWVEGRGRLFRHAAGEPERMIGVCQDITERKLAEEAFAEEARRKDEFLAVLAHELRNPLAPIRNALYLLRLRPVEGAGLERWRGMMERQVTHLTRLVDDLLDVSRINRGKISLQLRHLDLRELLRLTVEDQRPALEEAGLAIAVELPEAAVWASGDATRLTQVLDNLLDNARKFSERGARVTVGLEVDAPGVQAVITVRDTGIGIEPEMLPHLFDVFAQADRSLERSRGGLGLGLALVKGLLTLHGGSIEAHSAGEGQGAAFVVRLPLAAAPEHLPVRPVPVHGAKVGRQVLIIEDNRDAAESLADLLELYGCQVAVAHTGPAGLALARERQPEVIICDIGLPGMDGFAVAQALRQDGSLANTRLIAMSGYGQDEDLRRSHQAGFDDHLIKPVDPEQLLQYLREVETAVNE